MVYVIKPKGTGYYAGIYQGNVYNRARKYAKRYNTKESAQRQANALNDIAGYKYYRVIKISHTVKTSRYPHLPSREPNPFGALYR